MIRFKIKLNLPIVITELLNHSITTGSTDLNRIVRALDFALSQKNEVIVNQIIEFISERQLLAPDAEYSNIYCNQRTAVSY